MNKNTQLTQKGYDNLKEELTRLEEEERPKVAKKLKEAIAEGDLSENAAYEDAKDEQGRLEGRIHELKQILNTATIVKGSNGNKVAIGSTIKVKGAKGEKTYKITGSGEANPTEGKISYDSPIGKAFVGHKKGEEVEAELPAGKKKFKILDVS
ncbi:MAG: transcription elongation factor GreA [Candidatus Spechtbacterales bacterium]|nr:transcription elongation factor GreA [Candidatus Spechtbacterales bacterium]